MTSQFASNARLTSWSAFHKTLGCSFFILLLLQLWRPYYFLTDDNLTGWLPVAMDIGRHLREGETPFVNSYIFEGKYQLLRDPNNLFYWNPITLLSSYFLKSRASLALADISASVHLLVCAGAFTLLLNRLRDVRNLVLSDRRIVFLSLSFTFCGYALVVGPSWLTFLANQAALPILMLGLLHSRPISGALLVAFGFLYALLCGHLSPFLFTILFLGILVVAWGFVDKSPAKLIRFALGLALALIVASPLLLPAIQGFSESTRNAPLTLGQTSQYAVPMPVLIASFFAGYFGVLASVAAGLYQIELLGAFAGCAASGLALQSLRFRRPKRGEESAPQSSIPAFDACLAGVMILLIIFIMRPVWLAQILAALPLFRSLRWPFREVLLFVFFAHLWMAVRPVVAGRRTVVATSAIGALVFVASLAVSPWSFNPMTIDRDLLLSGQADAYWARIQKTLGPNDQIIAVIDPKMAREHQMEIPYSLLGAYNYPALFQVRSPSGYTAAGLSASFGGENAPYHWGGIFSPDASARLLRQYPNLRAMHLVSLQPLRIEIRDAKSRRAVELPPSL